MLLKEQDEASVVSDDYKRLGFRDVTSNPDAIEMKAPEAPNNKLIFKNSNIPVTSPYYIMKDFFKELIKSDKLASTGKELNISKDDDPYTYKKVGDNKFMVVSGPAPASIGTVFTPEKSKTPGKANASGFELTDEQLKLLPGDLNKEKGDMFRDWVNDNKTGEEIATAFADLPSKDKTLGRSGSFSNDHFKLAYITFKDEYDKHLKKFGTDNAPAFMGLKKAETGEGVNKDYFKFVIDDVAVAIDMDGNILQRPRGKGGSYVNEQKARIINRYQLLRERRLDVSYIVDKLQKGIATGNIKGMKKIPEDLKDIVKKKANTVKKTVKSKSKKGSDSIEYSSSGGYEDKLAKVLRSYEGFRSNAYKDTRGIPTIGIGATWYPETFEKYSGKVQMGQKVTEKEALFIKAAHVAHFQKKINSEIGSGNFNSLPDSVKAALQSKAFNYGSLGATLSSKVKESIKLGDFSGVSRYFRNVLAKHNEGMNSWRRNDEAGMIDLGYSKRAKIKFDSGSSKNKEKGDPLPYVYIADSQGRSGLGLAIRKRLGNAQEGVNFFQKNGATAAAIMNEFGDSINDAVSNTQNIIFTLGGNGSSKASFLAKDVLENAPKTAQITWILAPPAVKPTKKTTYVNTPGKPNRQVATFKATRAKYNRQITDGIRSAESELGMNDRINIIDPYTWFGQNVSSSSDGVHVDKKPGEEYVATIQSEIMPKSALAENIYRTRNGKTVITENQLRSTVRKILLEATENFGDHIKDRPSGDDFRSWVNKNHADFAKKIDLDSSGSHTNQYIKDAWDQLGDEYVKDKEAAGQKKKNLSTGGKYKFLKGSNPDGTYPAKPDRGLTKPYLKFVKDEQVFALDPTEPDPKKAIKQAERGAGKKVDFVSESQKILFERVLKRRIVEKYVNPAKVYMDLKKGRVDDPSGVFAKNKEKIVKIATAGVAKLKTDSSKSVDPKEHTFIDEDNLPIRFKQIDMSSGATEGEKILSAVGGTSHKTKGGAKKIVNLVLKPSVERFGKTSSALYYDRKGVPLSDAWKYIGTSETGKQRTAWSGHTLNSFIAPGHPFFDENKSIGTLGISYFWPWMIEKRKEVESDPESYIGQKIMMPFSKEEIDSRSDIELKDGVFSLNGRGGVPKGAGLKGFKAKSKKGAVSGAHMNVYSGGKLIGGNMSGTVKAISPRDGFHTIYFIMVEILPNKKEDLV